VSLTPQQPFIPPSGTSERRGAGVETPFRLLPPFVHAARHSQAVNVPSPPVGLPSIDDFLDSDSSIAGPTTEEAFDYSAPTFSQPADLPPIEHFTDPLPPVDNFAPAVDEPELMMSSSETSETEWVDTGWQDFDWNATAALGEASHPEASDEWSRTDWDSAAPPREHRETPAQAIASALDQIAQRIRNGDLLVPPADVVGDPAAIAATLAALLGVRR
jgi:hypothetical protein